MRSHLIYRLKHQSISVMVNGFLEFIAQQPGDRSTVEIPEVLSGHVAGLSPIVNFTKPHGSVSRVNYVGENLLPPQFERLFGDQKPANEHGVKNQVLGLSLPRFRVFVHYHFLEWGNRLGISIKSSVSHHWVDVMNEFPISKIFQNYII